MAQRFSAAIIALSTVRALAPEVGQPRFWVERRFSAAIHAPKAVRALAPEVFMKISRNLNKTNLPLICGLK
jgi:hypothetical protein